MDVNTSPAIHDERRRRARQALRALGRRPGEQAVLVVHCASAHHVAQVYRTAEGLVYTSIPRAHSHGDRDRHDAAHHGGHRDTPWVDLLAPGDGVDLGDPLPAGCECGHRSLSRARLIEAIAAGDRRMVID